jgi:hypothetical protein
MMKGWKTWAASIGGAATGLGLVVSGLLSKPWNVDQIAAGLMAISGAGIGVGIGHKVEKAKVTKYVITAKELKELLSEGKNEGSAKS